MAREKADKTKKKTTQGASPRNKARRRVACGATTDRSTSAPGPAFQPQYLDEPNLGIRRQVSWLLKDARHLLGDNQLPQLVGVMESIEPLLIRMMEGDDVSEHKAAIRGYCSVKRIARQVTHDWLEFGRGAMEAHLAERLAELQTAAERSEGAGKALTADRMAEILEEGLRREAKG